MNYIHQIKGFWNKQEVNQLGTSEIAMYFHLLEIWNKTNWINTFRRNNYKIMADLDIRSYKTLQGVRYRLQLAGILKFTQRNGDANVEYEMADLSNFYKGSGEGSVKGSGVGSVKGSGVVNINETKPNKTKHSKSHSSKLPVMGKINQASENVLYWKQFVETWNEFYKSKKGESYVYQKKDFACLKKIYSFLKKRSEKKEYEWTENNVINGFFFFLELAHKKEWLQENFSIPNILSQFNQIANGHANGSYSAKKGNYKEQGITFVASEFSNLCQLEGNRDHCLQRDS
jgi:hypothetical protein